MKALIVEDYQVLRNTLAQGVREDGWVVDTAADGEDGLWMATENPYDVVVLDLMLPKVNGFEVLRSLRAAGKEVPVIILTARDALQDRVKGLDMGADDYLAKPFYIKELLSRLHALVRRSYNKPNPVLVLGPLELRSAAREVFSRGEKIDLTAREYALLEYLARREGEVVSRADIWEHVYEHQEDGGSNVVDVYISYLRKKICPDLIETRRGQGYRLVAPPP